jgi:hypothetical protein
MCSRPPCGVERWDWNTKGWDKKQHCGAWLEAGCKDLPYDCSRLAMVPLCGH